MSAAYTLFLRSANVRAAANGSRCCIGATPCAALLRDDDKLSFKFNEYVSPRTLVNQL
jgi:hypothetical protein